MIPTAQVTTTPTGKKAIRICTEVEVETYADVDVTVPIKDIIDDIIDALDPLQAEEIVEKAGLIGKKEFEGVELRRHLCEITGLAYTSDVDRIMNELINRL